jgi:hypothetical protein
MMMMIAIYVAVVPVDNLLILVPKQQYQAKRLLSSSSPSSSSSVISLLINSSDDDNKLFILDTSRDCDDMTTSVVTTSNQMSSIINKNDNRRQNLIKSAIASSLLSIFIVPEAADATDVIVDSNDTTNTIVDMKSFADPLGLFTVIVPSRFYTVEENAPGTLMAIAYAIYFVFFIIFFVDPKATTTNGTSRTYKVTKSKSKSEMNHNEKTPLLNNNNNIRTFESTNATKTINLEEKGNDDTNSTRTNKADDIPFWKNVPVMMTFLIYFVLKMCVEVVLSATSVLSGFYFGWDANVLLKGTYQMNKLVKADVDLVFFRQVIWQRLKLLLLNGTYN